MKQYDIINEIEGLSLALKTTAPGSLIHKQILDRLLILNSAITDTTNELLTECLLHITQKTKAISQIN